METVAEEKLRGCEDDLPKLKRLAAVWKTKFSNSCNGVDGTIDRLRRNLGDFDLCDRLNTRIREIRGCYEDLMRAYEWIALHPDMPEQLFSTEYNQKMGDLSVKIHDIEEWLCQRSERRRRE